MVARTALLLAVAVCLITTGAHGQPAPKPFNDQPPPSRPADTDAALTGQARKLHREGMTHIRAGEYDKAYAAFAAAWGIKEHYRVAGPLGACELHLGRHRDAAEHLRFYLDHLPPDSDAADRHKTQELFNKAASRIVQLTVMVTPPNASLRVNGVTAEAGQVGFYEPGTLKLEATREGYIDARQTPTLQAGTSRTIELTLVAKSGTQLPPPGGPDARLIAGLTVGGAAVVGVGVGIVARVLASGHRSDVDALQSTDNACPGAAHCDDLANAVGAHNSAQNVALGGFVTGGVLVGVSTGLLIWWAMDGNESEPEPAPSVTLAPTFTRQTAGLVLTGTW